MTENLIILAGGASSRMKSSTAEDLSEMALKQANTRSKALILINERPMLDYVLYNAKKAGIKKVFIVISPKGDLFKEYYGKQPSGNMYMGLNISYAVQHIPENRSKPLGTADAVFQTLEQYPDLQRNSFLVCNCDNLYSSTAIFALRESKSRHAFINYNRAYLEYPAERIARFALTKVSEDTYLEEIIEKPKKHEIENYKNADGSFRVSMNIFKFDGAQFFQYLKECPLHPIRQEKELPTAILMMVKHESNCMLGIPMSEHVPDLTGKDDISVMNDYLSKHFSVLDWNK